MLRRIVSSILFIILIFCAMQITGISAPVADFDYEVGGSNVRCTSTSTNATEYNWRYVINDEREGSTGFCDQSSYVIFLENGGKVEVTLSVKDGNETDEITKIISGVQDTRDVKEPSEYHSCEDCKEAGYYWYNDNCHEEERTLPWNEKPPLPDAGEQKPAVSWGDFEMHPGILVLFIVAAIVSYLVLYKKEKLGGKI